MIHSPAPQNLAKAPFHSSRHRRDARAAFTLTEVIVASFIALVVTTAVLRAFSYARRMNAEAENRLACLHIARAAMEELRGLSYNQPALSIGYHDRLPGHPVGRGYYEVSQDDSYGVAKRIKVVVKWMEPNGREESLELTTVHSRGLHP